MASLDVESLHQIFFRLYQITQSVIHLSWLWDMCLETLSPIRYNSVSTVKFNGYIASYYTIIHGALEYLYRIMTELFFGLLDM